MAKAKMRKEARKKMLKTLKSAMRDDMHDDMKGKMGGMQKVTVASDSKEGLVKALKKAPELLSMSEKIMDKRKDSMGDDYECGGKKYQDGGIKSKLRKVGESGVLTDKEKESYKSSDKYEMPKEVKEAKDKVLSKADKIKELRKKRK